MNYNHLKPLQREEGNILIIAAFSVIIFLLMVAVVVDVGNLLFRRVQLQNAADAAALAAAGYWGEEVYKEVYKDKYEKAYEEYFLGEFENRYLGYIEEGMTEEEAEERAREEATEEAAKEAEEFHKAAHQAARAEAEGAEGSLQVVVLQYVGLNDPDGTALLDDDGFTLELLISSVAPENVWVDGGRVRVPLLKDEPLFFGPLVKLDQWSFGMRASALWEWSWEYANPDKTAVDGEIRVRLEK